MFNSGFFEPYSNHLKGSRKGLRPVPQTFSMIFISQFLRTHSTATDPHNPGLQFSNILKTVSVAVQTARAKCVIIDTAPLVPFFNGLLPVPPPVSLTLPIVHVHYDALTPPPLRPAPPTAHFPPAP